MRIGDTIEASIWIDGRETREDRMRFEAEVRENMKDACADALVIHGPVTFYELKPGDDRVPEVPDHVQGPDVRLLVAEAHVMCAMPNLMVSRRFVGELDRADHQRLREITRRKYARVYPGSTLTDMEADDYIEEIGPRAAMEAVMAEVNGMRRH